MNGMAYARTSYAQLCIAIISWHMHRKYQSVKFRIHSLIEESLLFK
jgi:hypothetical protein